MRWTSLAIALLLAVAGCAGDQGTEPPEGAAGEATWTFVEPPEQPEFPPPGGYVNRTPEEEKALRDPDTIGHLDLEVRDAATGEPVTTWWYYGVKYALDEATVDAHMHIEVDFFGRRGASTGRNRIAFSAGWYRLRLEADEYRHTWTPQFRIEKGKDTTISMTMLKANRLRAHVLDENGKPLAEGTLLLVESRRRGSFMIKDGVGESLVYDDEITLEVGRVFMTDYARQTIPVKLERGKLNEVTVHLKRP